MQGIHIFMNGQRGCAVVKRLLTAGHGVAAVYLPSRVTIQDSVLNGLDGLGVSLVHVDNPNESQFVAELKEAAPTLIVIAGYSTIFKAPFLNIAPDRIINLHAGALPGYRGGSPLNWQLIMGEKTAGISVIRLEEGIDTGNILGDARFPIGKTDAIAELHEKANALFPDLVLKVVNGMEAGSLDEVEQSQVGAKYWHQRSDEDGRINWNTHTAEQIERFVRALSRPYPGAFSLYGESRVRIFGVSFPDTDISGQPGRICYIAGKGPYVLCADKALLLTDYFVENQGNENGEPKQSHLPNGGYIN